MPHQTKESTSTAASLHSDALSTIPSTASSLDARPASPVVIMDALSGLPMLQKPGDAPGLPALSDSIPYDFAATEHLADFSLQDHMATSDLSPAIAVSDARPVEAPRRKSPPLAPKKKTHFVDEDRREEVQSNAADALRLKSPVIVELRTNVIVKDEYSLVTELSSYISTRYQRPQSSIMISVSHSSCLLYGGTFDPGYILTLSAVDTYTQSATNKRNTALLQTFLSETLKVPPERGVVRFIPVREDCMGTCGKTVAGELERVEAVDTSARRNLTTSVRKSMASALKRRPTNVSVHSNNSPPDSGPKSPYLAEKRRSLLSMGRTSKEDDRLQRKDSKGKSKSVSLHPPDMSEMMDSPFSSRSSLSVPSPVYMDRVEVHTEQQPTTSDTTTEHLLDKATKLLAMHASQDAGQSSGAKSTPSEARRGRTKTSPNHPPPAATDDPVEPKPTSDEPPREDPKASSQAAPPAASNAVPQHQVAPSVAVQAEEAVSSHRAKAATNNATQPAKLPPLPPPQHQPVASLPPLPPSQPRTPKMSRRKSLLSIFKRDQPAKALST